ncbi:MAG: hypothetical protein ACTSX8_04900 [Alphaproteobacteria bacterium]
MNFDCDGHTWERLTVVATADGCFMIAKRIDDNSDNSDDDPGIREDRREDLECILNRDVSEAELTAWIDDGVLPEA